MLFSRSGLFASTGEAGAPVTVAYVPTAVVFDGTNALYRIGASDTDPLVGAVDGKLFSAALAIKRLTLSGTGNFQRIVGGQLFTFATRWSIGFEPDDQLYVELRDASGNVAYFVATTPVTELNVWKRIGISANANGTSAFQIVIDGVTQALTVTTNADRAIDFTTAITTVGASMTAADPTFNPATRLNAEIADLAVYFDRAINWTNAAEWARHFEAGTHALQWKANDGSKPHGHPIIYLSGQIDRWHINRGSGHSSAATAANNSFVRSGTLTASASPPAGAVIPQFALSDVALTVTTLASVVHVQGSDNWPLAWASDGNLVTSWGDGSEPRDTNNIDPNTTRCSLGFARITSATYASFIADHDTSAFFALASSRNSGRGAGVTDINFVPGTMPPSSGNAGGGKCYAIQSLPGGLLYALVGSQTADEGVANTGEDQVKNVTLLKSTNNGLNWTHISGVSWDTDPFDYGWAWPTTINFGRANGAAQDGYLYWYAGLSRYTSVPTEGLFFVPCTNVMLVRVLVGSVETKSAYETFTGMSGSTPSWSNNFANRAAVPGLGQANANQLPNFFYVPEFDEIICVRNTNGDDGLSVTAQTNLQFLRSTSKKPWGPFAAITPSVSLTNWRPYDPDVSGPATSARGMFFFSVSPKWLLPSTGTTTKSVAGALTYTGRHKTTGGQFWDAWNSVGMTLSFSEIIG